MHVGLQRIKTHENATQSSRAPFRHKFSMGSSYYDIDDILADGEAVPVTFNIDAYGLGFLDGGTEDVAE